MFLCEEDGSLGLHINKILTICKISFALEKYAVESAVVEAAFANTVQHLDDAVLGRQN